ncbi:bifunctional [glutamine synthetase] adenylyltransferase/[glutamine synthetase]-adenylyl-L-tyrosine phosphorylase [Arthrobacter roseus]|uniref:bifunctional [glutamine synthetase] adenylyltransferase/[glutamine synthetase]-adenylyl-L-tyrosine phosphorylase n=1 Tax=Arthrobacter roseus TaxID=136274 RepID=UPI0019665B85|nr:bifunctional [glutamine synthetase] adenylyltransferase/[glutamine synthetase]-adenylyl-L-tyrosine phosphorylase [Arthrobacter roseus]
MGSLHQSTNRHLIAAGFMDLEKSRRFLQAKELELLEEGSLFRGLESAASPDMALQSSVRLLEKNPDLAAVINAGGEVSAAFFRLLGASEALAEFLMRHPEQSDVVTTPVSQQPSDAATFRRSLLESVGADGSTSMPRAGVVGTEAYFSLRARYRRHLTEIALRDLGAISPTDYMPEAARELSDLAAAAVEAALAVSRAELQDNFGQEEIDQVRLSVIGMGKCGARELNYISDVDVIYVIDAGDLEEAQAANVGTALAAGISRVISSSGSEPGLWEVDTNLRPEGREGPLVRTLESHIQYYQRWAKSWEFQALLKSRAIAGDLELGHRYEQAMEPLIWAASTREGFVESVQSMRKRVTANIPDHEVGRQIKLGVGGLRDVEFTVQLLQLVHGRVDETVRIRDTTGAIQALSSAGYISRHDAADFDRAYRYLRVLEHRIQLAHLRRTHLMPESDEAKRALARSSLGAHERVRPSAEHLMQTWRRTRKLVHSLHETIFYRPLLATASNLSTEDVKLSPEAARARLAALGYLDPKGAMRHIEALTAGISRRASLQRQLLPVLLGWLADGVDADAGLLGFRRLSEALGQSPWFLGMLRDSKAAAERLCHILSGSRFITDLLEASSESTAWLGTDKDLIPRPFEAQWQEIRAKMTRHPGPEEAMRLIRLIRRREILRTAIADSSGLLDQTDVGRALANADRAAILGALHVAERHAFKDDAPATEMLVVALGRQGGREIRYASDADVLYVHRPLPGADPRQAQLQAETIAGRVSALLKQPCKPPVQAERVLEIDANLRPEGSNGPLVRSLDSYQKYYNRWSLAWEAQALLRARPIAGSDALAEDFMNLVDPVRYPEFFSDDDVREIRRIKARVESERLPRGADPARHLKLGRGALSDVEWLVQLTQLQYAHKEPTLRTTETETALDAIRVAGLLPEADVETLLESWRLTSRIRAGIIIWSGRVSDQLPSSRRDLEAVARWCGYGVGQAGDLEEDYLRLTRRSRGIFERYFYGYGE